MAALPGLGACRPRRGERPFDMLEASLVG